MTLTQFLIAKISQTIPKAIHPVPIWISALIICTIGLIPNFASLLISGNTTMDAREFQSNVSTLGILFVTIIGAGRHMAFVYHQISNYVLDTIQTLPDLDDLEKWLVSFGKKRTQVVTTILVASLLFTYLIIASVTIAEEIFSIGGVITVLFSCFFMGMYAFEFVMYLNLHVRLSHYSYSLFFADPGSSELIEQLSKLFSSLVYLIGVITGIMTLFFAFWNQVLRNPKGIVASLIFLGLSTWGPLIIAFTVNQIALNKIIAQGKWKSLNQIQAQIEQFQKKNKIPNPNTLSQIRALLDYHDYIKSRRNSTIDIKSGLNFLNSILFPVLGFLLGSFKDIIDFFSR